MNYLSVDEFAKRLKISSQSVRNMIAEKKIVAFKLGSGNRSPYRIHEAELERFIIERFAEAGYKQEEEENA